MKNFEVKAIVTMVFPNVEAKAEDEAVAKVAEKIPATIQSKTGMTCGITIDDLTAKSYGFMQESENHNPDLIRLINKTWEDPIKRLDFIAIVNCLARRDVSDFANAEFYAMSGEDRCRTYCRNIADDTDLAMIINYCRAWDREE